MNPILTAWLICIPCFVAVVALEAWIERKLKKKNLREEDYRVLKGE